MFEVRMLIANPQNLSQRAEITLLADTEATYSVVPRRMLEQIGIAPVERAEFETTDGRSIQRDLGQAIFLCEGGEGTSVVIFGEDSDTAALGMVTLGSLGLQVDSIGKQLRPAKLILY